MTSNTPSTENLPTVAPDADTYVVALKDRDIVKVNLPAIPLTVQQRMDKINEIVASLLTTNGGQERLAVALETVRTFITSDVVQDLMAPWARSNNTDDIPLEKIRAALQQGVYDLRSSAGGMQIPTLFTIDEINSGAAIAGWRATNIFSSNVSSFGLPNGHGFILTIVKAGGRILQYFYGEFTGDIYYRTWRGDSPGNFQLVLAASGLDQSAVDARVDALAGDATRLSALAVALEELRGYLSKEQINQLLAGVVGAVADSGVSVPENLLALSRNLQIVKGDNQVWHKLNPFLEANSALMYATILGEARFDPAAPLEIDAIPGQSDTLVAGVETSNIKFYDDPNSPLNVTMPGFSSHISQTAINIRRSARNSFLTEFNDNFIISFDFAVQRALRAGESVDLLRFGNQTAVMGLSQQEGLYFNIGDTDGGEPVEKTSVEFLRTESNTETGRYDAMEHGSPEINFVMPGNCCLPLYLEWSVIRRPRSGGREILPYSNLLHIGDLSTSVTINDDTTSDRFIYTPNYYASGAGRWQLEINYPSSSEYIYSMVMLYRHTTTLISNDGYTRQSLLTGDNYGGSGDFNQTRDNKIQRYLGSNVIVEIIQGCDGYIKARAVIDGVAQNGGAFIDLRRTAEDLGIDDLPVVGAGNGMFIGNEAASIARIHAIKNSRPLTLKQLLQIYNHRDNVGSIYYERRSADDKYVIPAVLQANDANGAPTMLGGRGGLSIDLTADGIPKNYLTSPIISILSDSNANQRTIPEMENALAVVVEFGELDNGILSDATTKTVYNRRSIVNAHGAVSIWGGASRRIATYGFSFPNASTIRFDSIHGLRYGDRAGIHKIFLIR